MIEVRASNPDIGLYLVLKHLQKSGNSVQMQSRNGPVLRFSQPSVITWEDPKKRVSQDSVRDANPFFHLFECFWMLNGENDVKRPAYFAGNMASFSDDGEVFAGAYGYRWRKHFGLDQLNDYIIPSLAKNKEDRRCVLAMWDGATEPINGLTGGKDLTCNLSAVFDASFGRLDMTVFNRSNDIAWGACGANVVHFSMLQEYVAGSLGLPMGKYYQVSTNSHLYIERPDVKRLLSMLENLTEAQMSKMFDRYDHPVVPLFGTAHAPEVKKGMIDADIKTLMENYQEVNVKYQTSFFQRVVNPLISAFNMYKRDKLESAIQSLKGFYLQSDWIVAGTAWLERRVAARNLKIDTLPPSPVDLEVWRKTVRQVWPSASQLEVNSDLGSMPAYEAEVLESGKLRLANVALFNKGTVTIRTRGAK